MFTYKEQRRQIISRALHQKSQSVYDMNLSSGWLLFTPDENDSGRRSALTRRLDEASLWSWMSLSDTSHLFSQTGTDCRTGFYSSGWQVHHGFSAKLWKLCSVHPGLFTFKCQNANADFKMYLMQKWRVVIVSSLWPEHSALLCLFSFHLSWLQSPPPPKRAVLYLFIYLGSSLIPCVPRELAYCKTNTCFLCKSDGGRLYFSWGLCVQMCRFARVFVE